MDRESFYDRFSTSSPAPPLEGDHAEDGEETGGPENQKGPVGLHERFSTASSPSSKKKGLRAWLPKGYGRYLELLVMLVIAYDLVFGLIRPLVVEPMRVPSESMAPTLLVGDRVLTNKTSYDLSDPDRGALVVFESVGREDERVVKRVVGLPGDEILVRKGILLVNGERPEESYLPAAERPASRRIPGRPGDAGSYGPLTVPEGHFFVMGDNRDNSYDSRYFGPVPEENLIGAPSLRFWPVNRLGTP